ncbi:MAG: cytochrome P460 family protein [Bryobacteraceae bacterium]|nr:cytochrome P460 family protein [Bryobacteraceae bacterium]
MRALALIAAATAFAGDGPEYNSQGQLLLPADYREWIFLSSGIGMTYGPGSEQFIGHPAADNVYVNPSSWREFKKNGVWPDKTIFVLEIRYTTTSGSINNGGKYQTDLARLEAAVRDKAKLGDDWGYFNFGGTVGGLLNASTALPKGNRCLQCHSTNGAVDGTFAQFYPLALEVAMKKGTVRASYFEKAPPASPAALYELIEREGWVRGAELLAKAKARDAKAQAGSEETLNAIGYALAAKNKIADATAVLKHTAAEYPRSANAQDSLAEILEKSGDRAGALAATRRALELLPGDSAIAAERRERVAAALKDRMDRLSR